MFWTNVRIGSPNHRFSVRSRLNRTPGRPLLLVTGCSDSLTKRSGLDVFPVADLFLVLSGLDVFPVTDLFFVLSGLDVFPVTDLFLEFGGLNIRPTMVRLLLPLRIVRSVFH